MLYLKCSYIFSHFPSQAGSDGSLLTEIPAAVGATLGSSLDWSAPQIHHVPVEVSSINGILILNTYGTPTPTPQYNVFWGVPKNPHSITCMHLVSHNPYTECVLLSREQPADLFSVAIVQNPVVLNFQTSDI